VDVETPLQTVEIAGRELIPRLNELGQPRRRPAA
jgi:hypothetical protein